MIFLEYIRIAAQVLWAHAFRSFLTVLSITIGAFSIVLMSSLAESGLATLAKGIEDLGGARLIDIVAKKPERAEHKRVSYTRGLTLADRDLLFSSLPHLEGRSMFATLGLRNAESDVGERSRTSLVAGDAGFIDLFRMHVARGRGFSEEENRAHAKVCVVGHKLAEKLWHGEPLGRWLTVSGIRCHVIGHFVDEDRWGINFGFDWRDLVVVPFETAEEAIPEAEGMAQLLMKTDRASSNEIVKRIANALLINRHHGVDDFEIIDFRRFMDKFNSFFAIMQTIVGFIAGIALLVGGIGVMNMMLVSVSERVREIGVRKAIGATPRQIETQFLLEAVFLSGLGGAVGTFSGMGAALGASAFIRHYKSMWVGTIAQDAVLAALAVALGIGLLFGFFPARRAARLDAIEAIRR